MGDGEINTVQNWMKTKEAGLGVGQWSGDKGRKLLHGRRSSRKPLRRPRPRELRAFFSCIITRGKMKQESLLVSLFYRFLGVYTPENKYMEIVRDIGGAPGTRCSW